MAAAGDSGGDARHWRMEEAPDFRHRMLQTITGKLVQIFQGRYHPHSPEIQSIVAEFEESAFNVANSKEQYLRFISNKLISTEKRLRAEQERQMHCSQLQSDIAFQVKALHGGSSSMPQAGRSASPRGPSSQMAPRTSGLMPNLRPYTPNMQSEVMQEQTDMMTFLDQFLNFEPTGNAPMEPGIQPGPQPMQSVANQSQNQDSFRQLQATNFAGCSPTCVAMPGIQPYSQQNSIGRRNASGIGTQQSPLQSCKPEHMTPGLQHITGAHQSNLLRGNPQTPASMRSAREVDLIEKMFRQIKSWNEAYFSKFMELERGILVPKLTEEQLSSLPKDTAKRYVYSVNAKKGARKVLNFLQLQKSNLHEGLKSEFPMIEKLIRQLLGVIESKKTHNAKMSTGYQLQNCGQQSQVGNAAPTTGGKSGSMSQSRRIILAGTPPAHQQENSNRLLGVASPCSISASGTLQSLPTNKLECLTPSPVAKSAVAPSASPCALVKPILTSPVAEPVVAPAALPCAPVVSIPMDCDSILSFLSHDNAARPAQDPNANGSNQATPKATTSASPLQTETVRGTGEDQVRGGAETPVGNRPFNRLIDAIRSSSPAALQKSANLFWSVLTMDDTVPPGNIGTILDCKVSQQQHGGFNAVDKMKRVFDHTELHSESLPFGSAMPFECDASGCGSSSERSMKRHKTQNPNDALLEEIKSINNVMIDTVISITGDCGTDRITSCDGGTIIKLSYSAASLDPTLKALLATSEMSLVMPSNLFVPADYPSSSPVLIDEGDEQLRKKFSDISALVHVAFRHALRELPEPRSIKETARAWDACVRKAVVEFAEQHGGGTISSMLGRWERYATA
ncbi:mediator of RNA polymerase II transcription subunit 15a isoform X2 [Brachypodium distachyon]|uniref:mediator of RNA polymerase II transcription subunit 15a isoform X2 n=1 Tax=Brachypodium distachyon TaxID=15368 RepID=UPI00071DB7A5|nr:mediator of RNA polymerase II transcription subunit 15a isoform X2 [Brachypodium distachyon]|eukprot:XP_014751014.1 mediator of RNA polymerase II transcription subunit 15a isoform X2 [Brachypodium distachyon]